MLGDGHYLFFVTKKISAAISKMWKYIKRYRKLVLLANKCIQIASKTHLFHNSTCYIGKEYNNFMQRGLLNNNSVTLLLFAMNIICRSPFWFNCFILYTKIKLTLLSVYWINNKNSFSSNRELNCKRKWWKKSMLTCYRQILDNFTL